MSLARRYLPMALWVLGIAASIMVIAHTRLSTDMSAFLPSRPSAAQAVMLDQLHDGAVSRLMLVGIEGATPPALAAVSKAMAADLKASSQFAAVSNGEKGDFAADQQFLWTNRYLLSPAVRPDHFSVGALHAALVHDLTLLNSPLAPLVGPMLPHDPTGEMVRLIRSMEGTTHPATVDGVWMSHDHHRAVLLLQTAAPGFDIDAQQKALEAVQSAFDTARPGVNAPQLKLLTSGPGVFAVHGRDHTKSDASRFSLVATALVASILLAAYRSPRLLLLALLPVASGALAGMAAVALGFGYVHGITLGFGVTLIGEAVDYAIYLFTQGEAGVPPQDTLRRIWPTLRLGMLTSVCGFAAMLFSSFSGFAQLGLFTITGLAVALAVTRWVLPLLFPIGYAARTARLPLLAKATLLAPRMRWVLPVLTFLCLPVLALHDGPFWEDEISTLSPLSPSEQALDKQLRADLGAPDLRYLVAVTALDRPGVTTASEQVATLLTRLIDANALGGYDAFTDYVPTTETLAARQAALPAPDVLRGNLTEALTGLPFRPGTFDPFLADVEAVRAKAVSLNADSLQGTNLAIKVEALLIEPPAGWMAVLPLHNVKDIGHIEAVLAAAPPGTLLVDMKAESDKLLGDYRHEAITLSLVGSVVITGLLATALRSLQRLALVVLPLIASVILVLTLVTLGGAKLSIFNLFALLLTVAIGSNYCLFFDRLRQDPSHAQATVTSLVLANACTVIGFGILSFSAVPVLHGIGGTVALGAFLSMIFAAIVIGKPTS